MAPQISLTYQQMATNFLSKHFCKRALNKDVLPKKENVTI